jgi:hypothetical protein
MNLGKSVADALLEQPVQSLPTPGRKSTDEMFLGAGVYAIYYTGGYQAYKPVALLNRNNRFEQPIYVGRAVPKGARKGGFGLGAAPGTVLYDRMREHARSIQQATNLELTDFYCRFLVVDDIWIPLGESLLIEMFAPIWNRVIDGFRIHDPGKGRGQQQKSRWDMLHPGRPFAARLPDNSRSVRDILENLASYLSGGPAEILDEEEEE